MSLRSNILEFQDFVLDLDEKVLTRDGKPVSLPPKALELLLVLVERPAHIIEKEQLLERIWPDTFVEEGNLTYTIRQLRKALGDDVDAPRFIETVPRRGYRFVGDIKRRLERPDQRTILASSISAPNDVLIGRGKEIGELLELLKDERTRLVTLTGPGGTGKTRLAKEVGYRANEIFPDGVFFVGLEAVTDPSLVLPVIAHSLSIQEGAHSDSEQALAHEIGGRKALLILDNFEQVIEASAFVVRMMARSDLLKILVTSREPLRISSENEYLVPPLGIPSRTVVESAFALGRYEAVEFFIERARRVRPSFEVFEQDIRAIAEICQRLDGLPLALELAAARAKVLSATEILEKLERSLALLTGGAKDLPNRQQTMRAAIEWSYDLLTENEREVFAKLSIFEGGATFEAIEAVLAPGSSSTASIELVDTVTSLCDKSLLTSSGGSDRQRFRMLVVVREFAAELLHEAGSNDVSRTHAEYYTQMAEKAEPELNGADVGIWVTRLEKDHDNLRAALKWSIASDPELAGRIAKAMKLFWTLRGNTREAQYWYREALKIEAIPSEHRLVLLTGLANMTQILGDLEGARDAYEAGLRESELLGDPKVVAHAIRGLAGITYLLGDYSEARRLILQALEISARGGDEFGVAAASARLGDIALVMDEPSTARDLARDSLEIFKRLGFVPGIASKYMNLGMAEVRLGDIESARTHLRESLRIADDIGDYITTSLALMGLSFVLLERGEVLDGAKQLGAVFRMGKDIGHFLEPAERRMNDIYLENFKIELGEERFAQAYADGMVMDRREVIAHALGLIDPHEPKMKIVDRKQVTNSRRV